MKTSMRSWLLGLTGLLFGLMLVPLGGTAAQAQADKAKKVTITMTEDLKYAPERVTVTAGTPVEWINTSRTMHTVTADQRLAKNPDSVLLPEEAKPFNSGNMPPNDRFTHTFTQPGTYRYFCIPHEKQGMIGTVVVTPNEDTPK